MMAVSVVMYSLVRYIKQYPKSTELVPFAMIALPVPVYAVFVLFEKSSYRPSLLHALVLIMQGIVFVYLGNLYALKGIEKAPNTGYSVLISKIYVVFTTPLSVVLFNSKLSLSSIFAILMIVFFSYFVMIEKRSNRVKKTKEENAWIKYTLIAFLCFGGNALTSKYLLNGGMPIFFRLLFPGIVAGLLYAPKAIKNFQNIQVSKKPFILLLLAIAVCSILFNFTMQYAFSKSPNVGYVNAANVSSTAILAFPSALIFKDPLTRRRALGIIGVLAGTYILFLA